ncbi:MAG: glutathione S-transferase family protein [Rhodospirillales bacterium]|nr:glutathione S-transferase family protein [Rhodospirillales bacterium]MDP6804859.1 glutathione S-transferase family protein [Rhodospirillales bacterium]
MIKVYGRTTSINVQKVMWCCAEVDLEVERIDVGGEFGGTRDPAFVAKNPNATVPVLQDGGPTVWESNSIVHYLAEAYGRAPFFPADARRRALASQWMDWSLGVLNPVMRPVYVGMVQSPEQQRERVPLRRPFEIHPAAVKGAFRIANELWGRLDAHLADRRYVTGADFVFGDLAPGAWYHRWTKVPGDKPPHPNLAAWYARLRERPGYLRNVVEGPL